MTNVYKQQIVRLGEQEICVLWPVDSSQCATPNQPTMTQWLNLKEASNQQVRGHLQASFSLNQATLDILPFVREKGNLTNGEAVPIEQMHFVFRPSDGILQLTSGNTDSQTIEFVCKPWVKQKWWDIY